MEHRRARGDAMRLAFFDLDDTIYDRTHLRIGALLDSVPFMDGLGRAEGAVPDVVARVGRLAPLFEWFGFPNLRHHSESPEMIAALTVLYGDPSRLPDAWGITPDLQETFRRAVTEVERILLWAERGDWSAMLVGRLAFHRLVQSSDVYERLAHLAERISRSEEVLTAHATVRRRQVWQAYEGFRQSWSMFEESGARCFIASNGEEEIQKEKLAQLGLGREFESRLLTTGRAASPLDAADLRRHVGGLVAEAAEGDSGKRALELVRSGDAADAGDVGATAPEEPASLFPFVWVLDRFGQKTPDFYARVLHAVVASPDDPRSALDRLSFAAPSAWDAARPQFVMVGDNYDRDVTPLVELLGGDQGWTVLLRLGRHSRRAEDIEPGRAPTMQFDDWSALRGYLSGSFSWEAVPPITHAPQLCPSCVSVPRLSAHAPARAFEVVARLRDAALSCG